MDIDELRVGQKVHLQGDPTFLGVIVRILGIHAHVEFGYNTLSYRHDRFSRDDDVCHFVWRVIEDPNPLEVY